MGFAQDSGYTPDTFETIMSFVREGVNTQFGTSYTEETFVGTNWYKYAYQIVQRIQQGEVKTSEIFQKLQQYIALTNERIQRPSVSFPGLIESFDSQDFIASVKPPAEADAGKIFICVLLDDADPDYGTGNANDEKLKVATLISEYVAAGMVTMGSEVTAITLSNGQEFDFKFDLPDKTPILLRLTATKSRNQVLTVPSDEEIRQKIFENVNARYRLGWDFEPERYYGVSDALWANDVTLEWSDDAGGTWHPEVFVAAYTDLFTFELGDISVVIT